MAFWRCKSDCPWSCNLWFSFIRLICLWSKSQFYEEQLCDCGGAFKAALLYLMMDNHWTAEIIMWVSILILSLLVWLLPIIYHTCEVINVCSWIVYRQSITRLFIIHWKLTISALNIHWKIGLYCIILSQGHWKKHQFPYSHMHCAHIPHTSHKTPWIAPMCVGKKDLSHITSVIEVTVLN